jgi:hypothetical protein
MNRYDIRNKRSGRITHSYPGETQRPHNIAWGLLERSIWKSNATPEELLEVISETQVEIHPRIPGVPAVNRKEYLVGEVWKREENCTPEEIEAAEESITIEVKPAVPEKPAIFRAQVRLPQTYEVVVTDLKPELDAEAQRNLNIRNLRNRLKVLIVDKNVLTAAERDEFVFRLARLLLLKKDLD